MKKAKTLVSCLILFFFSFHQMHAQTTQNKFEAWPELKTFHGVISGTFHPSEDNDLAPIKERHVELAAKAKALSTSKIPLEFNNKEVQAAVKKLAEDSQSLSAMITKKATDAEIKKSLSDLHDTFHRIVEHCKKDGEEPAEIIKEQKQEGRE